MTDSVYIKIINANLFYPSKTYNALTLKEEIFKLLRIGKRTKLLYDVHALRDINLNIHEGERVGIIGANGAGKSTILKAIAGLYPLKSGQIETQGSIRAMFELSLGFEFEATGRENIAYRSLLLGESPKSLKEKEKEIIDFAEIGDFIDYPIKAYSSGMLVRLAFAISTTVSNSLGNILLLDEILGAGDASFQIKAKKRMEQLIDGAKIIVLVSHDLNGIKSICNRAILLKDGCVRSDGPVNEVIDEYLDSVNRGGR
ncbi:MAG TPA: ABC transporter ATP-binding protein [Prolixibacteraceae bacterium]|jgi:lipopolysaccharide transport system ATP-binding protein